MLGLSCVLLLAVAVLVARPFAEMGIEDDWSYVRSAEVLAATGHVVYNGWATAMLGWQLYWGALFLKLFGDSFSVARSSVFMVALATVYLVHRTLVRAGVGEEMALAGTLTLALSPLFMALSFSFMTDVPGLFCMVLGLYGCLRALEQGEDARAVGWLVLATLAGMAGGTARQIAWLTALVMMPSTVWLMRARRRVLWSGVGLWGATLGFVLWSLRWFRQQPYSLPEKLDGSTLGAASVGVATADLIRMVLAMPLFLLPLLVVFVPLFPVRSRRLRLGLLTLGLGAVGIGLLQAHRHKLGVWLAPYLKNYVSALGLVDVPILVGSRPVVLHMGMRVVLTGLSLGAAACCGAFVVHHRGARRGMGLVGLPWRGLLVVLGPFVLAYVALLLPRALVGALLDRYVLMLMVCAILVLARYLQEIVGGRRLRWSWLVLAIFGLYGVAGVHDVFALYRARIAAVEEVRAAGVPRTAIGGGFEYDDWTELEVAGYVDDPRLEVPAGAYHAPVEARGKLPCNNEKADLVPDVVPRFILSFDPQACLGRAAFAPVEYSNWLLLHPTTIYVLRAGSSR